MNKLAREKQVAVVAALVEGCSMRSTARLAGVDRETVGTLLESVGVGCSRLLHDTMQNLPCRELELDELWAFVGKKARNVRPDDDTSKGDCWTWLAVDRETKLVPVFHVGKRDQQDAQVFIDDLAWRLRSRVQISTDGLRSYVTAIGTTFGVDNVDYAQVVKSYEAEPIGPGRYSPPAVSKVEKNPIFGAPLEEVVTTSHAERMNLSVRMTTRRYTRLTNGFSKKIEQHINATALTLAAYNFVKQHRTIRCSPAMAAGITEKLWSVGDLVGAALEGVLP